MEIFIYPIVALLAVALFTREVVAPASRNSCNRRWLILATAIGASTALTALAAGYFFSTFLREAAIFPIPESVPFIAVGLLSFVLNSFLFYWWHRATHRFDLLWRHFHQLHHSARRVESLTAFFAHPLDTAATILLGTFSSYFILGASPLAAATALLFTAIFDLFVHADVSTPKWLGYFVQRPEMHTTHHSRNHHAQNYGLPVWDLLFGTWHNPDERAHDLGFDGHRAEKLYDMLVFRDVHT